MDKDRQDSNKNQEQQLNQQQQNIYQGCRPETIQSEFTIYDQHTPDGTIIQDSVEVQGIIIELSSLENEYKSKAIYFTLLDLFFGTIACALLGLEISKTYLNLNYVFSYLYLVGYSFYLIASIRSYFWVKEKRLFPSVNLYQIILLFSAIFLIAAYVNSSQKNIDKKNKVFLGRTYGIIEFFCDMVIILGFLVLSRLLDANMNQIQVLQTRLYKLREQERQGYQRDPIF